jgi:hypothetical protein
MLKLLRRFTLYALLCLMPITAFAQRSDCSVIVEQALAAADQACASTGRNQACYGNVNLAAEPQPDAQNFVFEKTGDLVNVADLQSLTLSPLDESAGQWGVALLRLQANLPDTLPGQNVTFLLFGDVEITDAADDDANATPMQAFYLRTGVADSSCEEAPESGMLVQTPEGVGAVTFTVNGVDVEMGSTVLFQADLDAGMTVSTLEGAAYVTAEETTQVIVPGSWLRVPLRERQADGDRPFAFQPGAPELPETYQGTRFANMRRLPLRLLQRRIEIAEPLTVAQIAEIRERIQNGSPLCGAGPFPACEFLLRFEEFSCIPPRFEVIDDPRPVCEPGTGPFGGRHGNRQDDNRVCVPPRLAALGDPRPVCEERPGQRGDGQQGNPSGGEQGSPPLDDRTCVFPPGPNDPPLPADETRPFCPPVSGSQPPADDGNDNSTSDDAGDDDSGDD